MVYTVKSIVTENNQIVYNDGVTKLFLYTKGKIGGSEKLKNLLVQTGKLKELKKQILMLKSMD